MTPDERNLLVAVSRAVAGTLQWDAEVFEALLDVVVKGEPKPITPRAKYVSIEEANEGRLRCDACDTFHQRLVRFGEFIDPSTCLCPTCISEAAAILEGDNTHAN